MYIKSPQKLKFHKNQRTKSLRWNALIITQETCKQSRDYKYLWKRIVNKINFYMYAYSKPQKNVQQKFDLPRWVKVQGKEI